MSQVSSLLSSFSFVRSAAVLIRLLMLQRRRRRMAAIRCLVHTQYTLDAIVKGRHQHQQHQQPHDPMLLLLFALVAPHSLSYLLLNLFQLCPFMCNSLLLLLLLLMGFCAFWCAIDHTISLLLINLLPVSMLTRLDTAPNTSTLDR